MGIFLRAGQSPPVVFIAQLGTGGDSWTPVIDGLPGVQTFTYDRPGTGDAPGRPAPNPPLTYSTLADELAELLEKQEIAGEFVLVGHSVGGHIARVFASRHPSRVAGAVFVDASIPQFTLWPDPEFPADGDSPDATRIDFIAGQVEILEAEPLDVPAVVVTRRRHWWMTGYETIPHPAIDDLWYASQRILAEQWRAPLVLTGSGHQIPREQPDLVAYAVSRVIDAVRNGRHTHLDDDRLLQLGGSQVP